MKIARRFAGGALIVGVIVFTLVLMMVYPGGRQVVGDFRLVREAGGTYKLQDTRRPENQLSNQGAVTRIGWDRIHILVKRLAATNRDTPWSNKAGWTVIDVDRGSVSRPLTDSDVAQRTDVANIITYRADSAYERGHRW